MTKLLQYYAAQWAEFWFPRPSPAEQPRPDISYDDVSQEQIQRMNECAKKAFAEGNWVTETLET